MNCEAAPDTLLSNWIKVEKEKLFYKVRKDLWDEV